MPPFVPGGVVSSPSATPALDLPRAASTANSIRRRGKVFRGGREIQGRGRLPHLLLFEEKGRQGARVRLFLGSSRGSEGVGAQYGTQERFMGSCKAF